MNLNIDKWKEFYIENIFNSENGDTDITQELLTKDGLPVISAGESNTGIIGRCSAVAKIFPENSITVDMFGYACPRGFKYKMVTHARVFSLTTKRHTMNIEEASFLATELNCSSYKYAYGRMCSFEKMKKDMIKLPIQYDKITGNPIIDSEKNYSNEGFLPDWDFMTNYIKTLHHKRITTKKQKEKAVVLNPAEWQEFKVGKLFTGLKNGKNKSASDLVEGNEISYIGAKREENGFMKHTKKDKDLISKGNCIVFICNGEGSVGFANYMKDDFIGTGDIVTGYNPNLNSKNGIFIATIASQERPRYSFGRKWKTTLKQTVIKLPTLKDENGEYVIDKEKKYSDNGYIPDWKYMEDYIDFLPYSDRI